MTNQEDKDYENNLALLRIVIGREHSIAISSNREGKTAWQVMPDELIDYNFFDWYCSKRTDHQFFENIHEAVTNYLHYRNIWLSLGSPDWLSKEERIDLNN